MSVGSEGITAAGSELRILLIEPNEDTRSLLELALSARGHSVTTGGSADDALLAAQGERFQMIVVERDLPDLDVSELCRRLRAEPNGNESTIIVLSEQCDASERTLLLDAGATDCLAWPDDAIALRGHLESLENASASQEAAETPEPVAFQDEDTIVLGRDGTIRDVGPAVEEWLGYDHRELVGMSAFTLFHLDDAPELLSLSTQAMGAEGPTEPVVARLRGGRDVWRRLRLRAVSRFDDPNVRGIVLLASPIERVGRVPSPDALHDAATRLPNHALFMDRLDHALQLGRRRGESVVAMVIDVENAADLDALYGPGSLEETARQVAARVHACLRAGDTVGRLRAEEFGAIVEGCDDVEKPLAVARRIVRELNVPFAVAGQSLELTPCVGVAISWGGSGTVDDVLREARLAHHSAAASPRDDGHYAMHELGDPLVVVPEPSPDDESLDQEATTSEESVYDSLWFSPLMDRIGALEREIGLLSERRSAERTLRAG